MSNLTLSLDISTTATGWAVFHGSYLVQSGVLKHKSKSYFERGRFMASELRAIQSRALQKYDEPFESIVVEKNSVMGPNQQSMISIGIVTGIILGRLIADNVFFVKVSDEFDMHVKDDEADAILIGSYFVNYGQEFGGLESHKIS